MADVGGFSVGDEVVFIASDQDPTFWPRISRPHVVVKLDRAAHKVGVGMAGTLITSNTIMHVPPQDLMHWEFYRTTMELSQDGPANVADHLVDELAMSIAETKDKLMYKILTGRR